MFSIIEPYIKDVLVALVGLLTSGVIYLFAELRKRLLVWIDSRNDLKHQEYLHYLAEQAFSYIEASMKDAESQDKLNEAIYYVSRQLEKKKIDMSTLEIRAAIEVAVLQFNKDK